MSSQKRRILVVDDDELSLFLLEEVLSHDFDVARATSGEEALSKLETFPAELVLLDIMMPGLDGYETCRRIKADPRTASIKVLLVSGRNRTEERLFGYEVGASDYIVKPFDADELLAKVRVFLELKLVQEESRAKSEFLANMSHEIRTPMTAILGYSENLRDFSLPEDERCHAIDTICRNGQHLIELLNNILDLSKIEAKKLQLERYTFNPADILHDVASLMRGRAEDAGLLLRVECDGMIPTRIASDRTRMKQILINLVGNAIKFTPMGEVRMVVRCLTEAEPQLLEVDVVDTGIGIDAEQIKTLCDPFVQADASVTRRFGGTGLGLSISRRLARLLGGDITIRSRPDEGSTFTLSLTTGDLENVPMVEYLTTPLYTSDSRPATPAHLPYRILLVEDGADNQRLLTYVLHKASADVVVAGNGAEGVAHVQQSLEDQSPFDIVLMDMQMPILDGYRATQQVRDLGYRGPILALTAHALAGDRDRCIAAGCDEFTTKPINRASLMHTIEVLVAKHRDSSERTQEAMTTEKSEAQHP